MTRTAARDLGRYGVTCNAITMSETSENGLETAAALAATLCLDFSTHVNGIRIRRRRRRRMDVFQPAIARSFHKWGVSTMDEMDNLFPTLFE